MKSSEQLPSSRYIVYEAEGPFMHSLQSVRDSVHKLCHTYMNRLVRIQTIDGFICEGTIVNCEQGVVYIKVLQPVQQRLYNTYMYHHVILPLVLYELLRISLL